ncbi:MAG: hypothetical protein HDR88_16085 [Bacteroides sp.]|nr:hypothetical protein [Bacteroides sp.]
MAFTPGLQQQTLLRIVFYYLYIPLAIFLCTWVKLWYSLPLTIILGILPLTLCPNLNAKSVSITSRQIRITVAVLLAWVILSGIGGFVWQNRWDHSFRNAVFNDLVSKSWPVIEGQNVLTYYIGFWLPSAGIAKITGYMWIGRLCQLLYGSVGIILAFLLTIEKVGNMKIRYLLPFILFSGVDIVGLFLSGRSLPPNFHIELWSSFAFWESNTTLLFWVYNQAIPSWVATMIMLNFGRHNGIAALTLCFLSISAPFSVVGLFPLALYYVISPYPDKHRKHYILKSVFCPANIISLLGILPVLLYFMFNNQTTVTISFGNLGSISRIQDFILILVVEILVFGIFIYRQIVKNIEFYILFLTTVFCLFIHMGTSRDFNSRVELPLNFFMTTQIMIYISRWGNKSLVTRLCFLGVSFLAALTPFLEMSRILYQSVKIPQSEYLSIDKESIFEFQTLRHNFVSDSIYSRSELPLGFKLFNYPDSPDKNHQ